MSDPKPATRPAARPARPHHVLVVEDDQTTSDTVRLYLEHAGFEVVQAFDGDEGLRLALGEDEIVPDLVVLDWMLPGLDGLSICEALRTSATERGTPQIPILMLTARAAEDDRIRGLDLGADDYLPKPFSPRELVSRVKAILRRTAPAASDAEPLRAGNLVVDPARRTVHRGFVQRGTDHRGPVQRGPVEIALTPTEFSLLETFVRRPGVVATRSQLVERVLGHDFEGDERTIDAHVKNLRRKLEAHGPRCVHTVFGVGYRFELSEDQER